MWQLIPTAISTQMILVLALKFIPMHMEKTLKRAGRNWVSLQATLLKKPRTPSSGRCPGLPDPNLSIRFCPSPYQPIDDVWHIISPACPVSENPEYNAIHKIHSGIKYRKNSLPEPAPSHLNTDEVLCFLPARLSGQRRQLSLPAVCNVLILNRDYPFMLQM